MMMGKIKELTVARKIRRACPTGADKLSHGHPVAVSNLAMARQTWHSPVPPSRTMSHSHTHAPGEQHSHSHGPPQPQAQQIPAPDPALQALIDQDFSPSPLTLSADNTNAICAVHKLEKCDDCGVDFINTNRLARLLVANPNLLCPPPSNVISQNLTKVVTTTKDEGNVCPFAASFIPF